MKYGCLLSIALILLLSCIIPQTEAATINATNCSQTDVWTAINSASDGDTVIVPAGICAWSNGISIAKSLRIKGAGIDQTIIQDKTDAATQVFYLQGAGKTIRLESMTIDDISGSTNDYVGSVNVGGTDNTVVLYYIKFSGQYWRALTWYGTRVYGVISHCYFDGVSGVNIQPSNWDEEWTTPMSYGTATAVFIEDSTFTYPSWQGGTAPLDSKHGARIVFRHNTVNNSWIGNHGCDSVIRSSMQAEVYSNTFNGDGWTEIQFRGGSGIVYDNTINGYHSGGALQLTNYRSQSGCDGLCGSNGESWACMGGYHSFCNGTDSVDGNTGVHGYPCRDQIGRGANQNLYPMYQWNNSGYSWTVFSDNGGTDYSSDHIQENRDYFNCGTEKCPGLSYTPYTYPHPLTLSDQQTCSELGGTPCQTGQTCSGGSFAYSSDYGNLCCVGGTCQNPPQTCADGTPYNQCSATKPKYCSSGTLTNNCQVCGCPSGQSCQANGACASQSQYSLPEQIVQAESGTLSGMQTGSASGIQYIYTLTDDNGSASYTFQISNSGKYLMQAMVNNNNNDGLNSFYVGLDSEPAEGNPDYAYGIFPLNSGFFWDNVSRWGNGQSGNPPISEFDPMVWDLTAGIHTFTFYGREANTWLDQIILKRIQCHKSDTDQDGCVSSTELFAFIDLWKVNSSNPTLKELIEAIGLWKRGGC